MEHLTHSAAETEALGCRLGCALAPGTVIAYRGGLGMGKTAFTRGLARGLDCRDRVTSPTFTIVNEYQGRIPLFHFDMYRFSHDISIFDVKKRFTILDFEHSESNARKSEIVNQ